MSKLNSEDLKKWCSTANILILSAVPSLSHNLWNQKLAKSLGERNHTVTILDVGRYMIKHEKVKHIELENIFKMEELDLNLFATQSSSVFVADYLFNWTYYTCENLMQQQLTKSFYDEHKIISKPFDLIIYDAASCEAMVGFVEAFGSPPLVIATAFYAASIQLAEFAGQYDNPAYVPYPMFSSTSDMSFMERMHNSVLYLYHYYSYHIRYLNKMNSLAKTFFGKDLTPLSDLLGKADITLINYHPAIDGVRPLLPNIVPIGGFHIDRPEPLDKEMKTFLDNSKNGVIYFSFGSNIKCTMVEEDKLNLIIQVLKEIKFNVIWKCEKEIVNLPKNVRLGKWFKQKDILAHPNVKLFISHGGLLSTQEAIHHAVPMLIVPFVIDQHFNAMRLVKMGLAEMLSYNTLTRKSFRDTIFKMMTTESYREKMTERSAAFRDNPLPSRDLAIYWIEYALKHPRSDMLRSPTQRLSIHKILLLDVFLCFSIIAVLMYIMVIVFIQILSRLFFKKPKRKIN